jgi:hypothetical protein
VQKARIFRTVFERQPNFANRGVDRIVRIYENVFAPDTFQDFLTGDQLAATLDEQSQQLEGKAFEADDATCAAKLKGGAVELQIVKAEDFGRHGKVTESGAILPRSMFSV